MKLLALPSKLLTAFVLSAAVVGTQPVLAQPVEANAASAFADAMAPYKIGKWADAFERFAALADRNHVDAARIALLMLRFGPSLYGSSWSATPHQIDRWLTLASRNMAAMDAQAKD